MFSESCTTSLIFAPWTREAFASQSGMLFSKSKFGIPILDEEFLNKMCSSLVEYSVVFLKWTELGEIRTAFQELWPSELWRKTSTSINQGLAWHWPLLYSWFLRTECFVFCCQTDQGIAFNSFQYFSLLKPQTLSQGRHI